MSQATTHRVLGTTRLRLVHRTRYHFEEPLEHCRVRAYLQPHDTLSQRVIHHQLEIVPEAPTRWQSHDDHGNLRALAELSGELKRVEIQATTTLEIDRRPGPAVVLDDDWTNVVERSDDRRFWAYLAPAVGIPSGTPVQRYARLSFPAGRSLGDGLLALLERIAQDFPVDAPPGRARVLLPKATDLTSFTVGCLRSLGLPARYLHGYRLDHLGGQTKRSRQHAWASVWTGDGWLDVDPTLGRLGRLGHVLLAHGRDAAEIAPVTVRARGGGKCQRQTEIQIREPAFEALPFAEARTSAA